MFSWGGVSPKPSARNMCIDILVELPLNLKVISVRVSPELVCIRAATKTSSKPLSKMTNVVRSWDLWVEFPVLTLY